MSARKPTWLAPIMLLAFTPLWALMLILNGIVAGLGWIMVPFVMWRYRDTKFHEMPWFLTPWKNPEDWWDGILATQGRGDFSGSLPPWWKAERKAEYPHLDPKGWRSFVRYHAERNSADGLRNFTALTADMANAPNFKFCTNRYFDHYHPWYFRSDAAKELGIAEREQPFRWHVTWSGWLGHLRIQWEWSRDRYCDINWGWKIEPRDVVKGVEETSVRRVTGAPFGFGTKPWRKIK